ncbi:MAG TPA: trimeric intracellular cation channel family protein [Candidatus Limnocylindrales bacterium]|nr:trimeric intracellular cation channel family protein [Candidatus Limnocylindrales bacterium]
MNLLLVLDLLGTLVFAFSGSLLAARRGLDVFGFVVLALAAGTAGGVLRDVLIGATPPVAVTDWRYAAVCIAAALFVFAFAAQATRIEPLIRLIDAFGLGLFAAAGTTKALDADLGATAAIVLGVLTAVGGGVARDVLAGLVPVVLRAEIYALAAALGSIVIVVLIALGASLSVAAPAGAITATGLRLAAMRFNWQAPRRAPIDA